jgi:hypothetical protein
MADRIDCKTGGGRAEQRGQRNAETEDAVVARALHAFADRADEVLHRDGVKDITKTDQRGRHEERRKAWENKRQQQPGHETARAEDHRSAVTIAVRELPGID